jgi:hypothetical protein
VASKHVLLAGIDIHADPQNNLNSCVADTRRFRGLLQSYYGFQPRIPRARCLTKRLTRSARRISA